MHILAIPANRQTLTGNAFCHVMIYFFLSHKASRDDLACCALFTYFGFVYRQDNDAVSPPATGQLLNSSSVSARWN